MSLYNTDSKAIKTSRISKFYKLWSYESKLSSLFSKNETLLSRVAASSLSDVLKERTLSSSSKENHWSLFENCYSIDTDLSNSMNNISLWNLCDSTVESISKGEEEVLQVQTQILTQACQADTSLAKDVFVSNFLRLIYQSDFEYGYITPADEYVENALKDYGVFAMDWISEIFHFNYSQDTVIIGLMKVLSHLDHNLVSSQGMIMATAALRHKNLEVVECGIRCFENWEDPKNAEILKSITFEQQWLNRYSQDVIKDLESLTR